MTHIITYLTFNGNCREAMSFYKECLGGALSFQTVGDAPHSNKMSNQMKNTILHASLIKDEMVIMASDMVDEKGLIRGNAVSLMLNCSSEKEIKEYYKKLAEKGIKTHPLEATYWGALFGSLTDKYGNHWLLHYSLKS